LYHKLLDKEQEKKKEAPSLVKLNNFFKNLEREIKRPVEIQNKSSTNKK